MRGDAVAASADRAVLDGAARWTNLTGDVVERLVPSAWVLDAGARPA